MTDEPVRPYSRPPFAAGNTVSRTHGSGSERTIAEKAAEVRDALLEICPWLAEPEYAPAVARFLRAESRALLLHDGILKQAEERGGPDKVASRMWEQATAADRLAAQLGNALGLDPLGAARLRQTATAAELNVRSLADLAAEGRAAYAGRDGAIDGTATDDEESPDDHA